MNEELHTLPPFIDFCVKILGYEPSVYNDYAKCFTYLECLTYTYTYLKNQVVPAVDAQNAVIQEMKDYIDHYFDNLDVQEEINNKLDEMAQNGELTALISDYVSPYIENQNTVISNFVTESSAAINNQNAEISAIQSNTETAINTQNQTINSLSSRVSELSTLTQGSTTGDAELIDIRTAYNGVVYSNAGNAVRAQTGHNNDLINGLMSGVLNNTESLTVDKLSVDNNYTMNKYSYHQDLNATASSAYITYIHDTAATEATLIGKIIVKTDMHTMKIHTRVSGTNYFFYTLTNLKAGDVIYLNKTITIPTSNESTIRLLITVQNTTAARDFDLINPIFLQNGVEKDKGTIGYENASAGTVTNTNKTFKALATKEYVQNAISGGTIFSSMNLGCAGDSITTEQNGATNWPTYVNSDLVFNNKHNVAVGSSTYQYKKVTYNNVEYTPQNYGDVGFAGYSTASVPTSATEAQKMANNCAKNHVEQFIAEVSAGTYPAPDIFIFAYGTNDNTNLGSVEDAFSDTLANINKYTLAGGMRYAVEKISTAYPNCQIFILNILQSAYEGYQSRPNQIAKNNIIKGIADYFSIPVFNQYSECGITRLYEHAGTTGRYLSDGLHPSTAGKKKQAEYVVRCLKDKTTNTIA